MKVTKIKIRKVIPKEGLVGFVSFVLDDCFYIGNIAIFSRLNKDTFRLVFPEKKIKDKTISLFHPLTEEFYFELEKITNDEMKQQNELK